MRASNATDREIAAIEKDAEGAWRMGIAVAKISALVVPVAGIAMQVSFLVVLGVGGFRVASGAITVASLVAFILFLFMMILPLGTAFGAVTSVNSALGALGRIQEIIDLPGEGEQDNPEPVLAHRESTDAISFEDVLFRYRAPAVAPATATATATASIGVDSARQAVSPEQDRPEQDRSGQVRSGQDRSEQVRSGQDRSAGAGDESPVLHGVSFSAPQGKRTALVGPSGAGKSTILALIERFYDPDSGVVRLGGTDIRAIDRTELRAQLGYVEQDAPVLAGTLRDNLKLSAPHATDEQCVEVLRAVNLTEVLDRSERGLDAPVGEDGVMLSGGERQRLAIARTLLAAPPILLLDESTSSLDGLNEQLLRKAIDAVATSRTLIVIAHRLSTVIDSDQIVVLDHGKVVGVGTHAELIVSTPLYKELAQHQLLA